MSAYQAISTAQGQEDYKQNAKSSEEDIRRTSTSLVCRSRIQLSPACLQVVQDEYLQRCQTLIQDLQSQHNLGETGSDSEVRLCASVVSLADSDRTRR